MARTSRKEPRDAATRHLGLYIGESIGAGIAQGIAAAFTQAEAELLPLGEAVVTLLRTEAQKAAEETAALIAADQAKVCGTPGCPRRPVARGLCRRHYARQVYQERKERSAAAEGIAVAAPRRRARSITEGDAVSIDKKNVNPVAPIVRRRKGEAEQAAVAKENGTRPEAQAAAGGGAGQVKVEDVARFFGLK